jgi:hypothetical protein
MLLRNRKINAAPFFQLGPATAAMSLAPLDEVWVFLKYWGASEADSFFHCKIEHNPERSMGIVFEDIYDFRRECECPVLPGPGGREYPEICIIRLDGTMDRWYAGGDWLDRNDTAWDAHDPCDDLDHHAC